MTANVKERTAPPEYDVSNPIPWLTHSLVQLNETLKTATGQSKVVLTTEKASLVRRIEYLCVLEYDKSSCEVCNCLLDVGINCTQISDKLCKDCCDYYKGAKCRRCFTSMCKPNGYFNDGLCLGCSEEGGSEEVVNLRECVECKVSVFERNYNKATMTCRYCEEVAE